jgi:hypothetical protein
MKSFRASHAWLRGHSDRRAGKPALDVNPFGPEYQADYLRGYAS